MTTPTSICVDNCQFAVDGDGRLVLNLTPSTACAPNLLECDGSGLHVTKDAPHLHQIVTNSTKVSIVSGGRTIGAISNSDATVDIDTGTARGLWTVGIDKSVTIVCPGVYSLDAWGGAIKSTGSIRGQQIRTTLTGVTASTFDDRDYSNTVDLSTTGDGPEANCSCIRKLAAGVNVAWRYFCDNLPAGSSSDYSGEFSITYLGENA